MRCIKHITIVFTLFITVASFAQDIEIFQQFNGRYDYTAIGNTLNPFENNLDNSFCFPLESSSANLILSGSTTVVAAYLYWAGSGTGDTSVTLNGIPIEALDTYTVDYTEPFDPTLTYFSCYADITDIIISEGNTIYEFSDLDITDAHLSDNAFNGTNTFTNSNVFYNCDLDVYDIQDNISIGDTSATIKMTTGGLDEFGVFRADLIIINNIITVLNSQLPDATIALNNYDINCGDRTVFVDYTVFNTNSTEFLPEGTLIAFYADGILIGQSQTQNDIPIGASENGTITLTLPETISDTFLLTVAIDDDGTGNGSVIEINENNNRDEELIQLLIAPPVQPLENQISCNEGFNAATFNLVEILQTALASEVEAEFFESLVDLEDGLNGIINPEAYSNSSNPITIYAKIDNPPCYDSYAFELSVENCPPYIPEGFSPNNDGFNDWFNIQGLYNIFERHELKIFNRYGTLIFEGNNDKKWYGLINRGLNNHGKLVPVGTYFYILNPNDALYEPMVGWVYVNY